MSSWSGIVDARGVLLVTADWRLVKCGSVGLTFGSRDIDLDQRMSRARSSKKSMVETSLSLHEHQHQHQGGHAAGATCAALMCAAGCGLQAVQGWLPATDSWRLWASALGRQLNVGLVTGASSLWASLKLPSLTLHDTCSPEA